MRWIKFSESKPKLKAQNYLCYTSSGGIAAAWWEENTQTFRNTMGYSPVDNVTHWVRITEPVK